MELPDQKRFVKTYVPLPAGVSPIDVLRSEVLPHIRELQTTKSIRWFSFLVHTYGRHFTEDDPGDKTNLIIHLLFEPATDLDDQEFIGLLPHHFLEPKHAPAAESVSPKVDKGILREHDHAYGWKLFGECSEWVLCLLENYDSGPPLAQIVQFLHYITNPLGLGEKCVCFDKAHTF